MSNHDAYHLAIVGCGTAGVACVRELTQAPTAPRIGSFTLVDRSDIREVNANTCPEYAGHAGRPKSLRLAELAAQWLGRKVPIRWLRASVEALPWQQLIASTGAEGHRGVGPMIAVAGLDDWESRLCLIEELRRAAPLAGRPIVAIQCGLDRNEAQVSVFGMVWSDPCPACGLNVLPETEPCTGRGDLQREARAAAALVSEIVAAFLSGPGASQAWLNTKTNLVVAKDGGDGFRRLTHFGRRQPGCLGPHSPNGPLRWDPASCALRHELDGAVGGTGILPAGHRLEACATVGSTKEDCHGTII